MKNAPQWRKIGQKSSKRAENNCKYTYPRKLFLNSKWPKHQEKLFKLP